MSASEQSGKTPDRELLEIRQGRSVIATQGGLIISSSSLSAIGGVVELVVGRVGFPSVRKRMQVGDALLFETPDSGLFEVRITAMSDPYNAFDPARAAVMVSRLTPRPGLTGGFVDQDLTNAPFEPAEIKRIAESLDEVRADLKERRDLNHEQIDLISRKLDEMAQAAERLGRRDWLNIAIGTLTNVIVSAAVNAAAAKFLFQRVGNALAWLVGETIKLLP